MMLEGESGESIHRTEPAEQCAGFQVRSRQMESSRCVQVQNNKAAFEVVWYLSSSDLDHDP